MKQYLTIFFFFVFAFFSAQNPYSIHYSINEGFPTSTVYGVEQDEKGFLWFSTDVGVIQYDSHRFNLINTDNGLSDNEVFKMKMDYKKRKWFLTLSGKLSFIYNDKIYNENNSDLVRKASGSSITTDFYQDDKNNIYITFRNGEITQITPNDQVVKSTQNILSLGGIWKYNNAIFTINGKGIFRNNSDAHIAPFNKNSNLKIYHTALGNYLANVNVLYKIEPNNQFDTIAEIPKQQEILYTYPEKPDKVWIGSRNGLYLFEKNKPVHYFFEDYSISSIIKDFEGGYWISTLNKGVIYVPSFDINLDDLQQSTKLNLNCISINSKKEIWIGSDKNTYFIKKPNQTIAKKLLFEDQRTDKINNIRFFGNDTYVIGKLAVKKIDANGNEEFLGFSANDILIDDKNYYIGYTYTYWLNKMDLEKVKLSKKNLDILINKRSKIFSFGSNNSIWIGTNYGLYQFYNKSSIVYWGNKSKELQTSIEDITYDEQNGKTLIASASKGIIIISKNNLITHFKKEQGLNSNTCNSIKKIKPNLYLVGTNSGLNSIEFINQKYVVKNLNSVLGLGKLRVKDIDYLDNTIYLATENGLLFFKLNNLSTKKNKPKCSILKLISNNKTIEKKRVFQHNQNDISIEFNGISYLNQGSLTYFYQLNNQNGNWTNSNESKINYKSLSPGKYTFSVYCMDGFNVKSDIQSISFEILPPFWRKPWFIFCLIIFAGILMYTFFKYRLNLQKKKFEEEKQKIKIERDKAQLEKQMVELEQKALRLQMNPHFIFNALNTIKGYYSEGDSINASSYISKFSKLLRMLLENTEQSIPLKKEIEMLEIYINLTKIRYKDKFDYEITIDENLNTSEISIPTLLLQPMVENAVIHGLAPKEEKGKLHVSFLKKEEQLQCIVEDNGIGRVASMKLQKNKEHQSKALEITNERLELFNNNVGKSTIEILDLESNSIPTGTKVVITIPLISIW